MRSALALIRILLAVFLLFPAACRREQTTQPGPPGGSRLIGFTNPEVTVDELDRIVILGLERSAAGDTASVRVAVAGGTAVNGMDYEFSPHRLAFAAPDSALRDTVRILVDVAQDGDRTLILELRNPTDGYALATPHSATITIHVHPIGTPGSFPMATGSTWTYARSGTFQGDAGGGAIQDVQQDGVIGPVRYRGLDYQHFQSHVGDNDHHLLLRQVGNIVYGVVPGDTLANAPWPGLPGSLPWKLFDFDAPAGASWVPFSAADTTSGGQAGWIGSVYSFKVEALGTTSVTVPAGDFPAAYHFRTTETAEKRDPAEIEYQWSVSTEYYVVLSLGIVMEKVSDSDMVQTRARAPADVEYDWWESDLTSFQLGGPARR